jgi:hypothetical protein
VALAGALGVSCAAFADCDDILAVYGGTPPVRRAKRPRKGGAS